MEERKHCWNNVVLGFPFISNILSILLLSIHQVSPDGFTCVYKDFLTCEIFFNVFLCSEYSFICFMILTVERGCWMFSQCVCMYVCVWRGGWGRQTTSLLINLNQDTPEISVSLESYSENLACWGFIPRSSNKRDCKSVRIDWNYFTEQTKCNGVQGTQTTIVCLIVCVCLCMRVFSAGQNTKYFPLHHWRIHKSQWFMLRGFSIPHLPFLSIIWKRILLAAKMITPLLTASQAETMIND